MRQTEEKNPAFKVIQGFDIKQLIINQQHIIDHIQRGGTLKNFKANCSEAKTSQPLPTK